MGEPNDVFVWLGEASRVFEPSADRSMFLSASANRRVNMNQVDSSRLGSPGPGCAHATETVTKRPRAHLEPRDERPRAHLEPRLLTRPRDERPQAHLEPRLLTRPRDETPVGVFATTLADAPA